MLKLTYHNTQRNLSLILRRALIEVPYFTVTSLDQHRMIVENISIPRECETCLVGNNLMEINSGHFKLNRPIK